jgi:hypothetical protein
MYLPSDKVFIVPLNLEGFVTTVIMTEGCVQFEVRYYIDMSPMSALFYERELAKI